MSDSEFAFLPLKLDLRLLAQLSLLVLAAGLVLVLIDYLRILRLRRQLPPGPFPLPIVGNHLVIPKVKPWIAFEEWSNYYKDPLVTVWLGRRPIIIANDAWSASELMEKRAHIYSSRPHIIVMGDMFNWTVNNQVCQVYGDRWRNHRKLTHSVVGSQAVRTYRGIQAAESKVMTWSILKDPTDYVFHLERYACSVVSIIGWGRRITRKNDYVAKQALEIMANAVDVVIPGLFWMESLPFLTKLPKWLYPLPRAIQDQANLLARYFYALSLEGSQNNKDSFSKRLIEEQNSNGLSNAEIASLTSNLIGGGVDTTSSTILSCILAMCVFPEAQKKAHEELDVIIGHDRSPDWSDESSLHYIDAIIKETLRWRSVTILGGIPHAPIQDDIYNGYHIPAGTNITGNLWAIHRHPREFPDPDEFEPERYLKGLHFEYPNGRGHNAFGWGRRQCSGQPLAEASLAISVARLLWAFEIKPGSDDQGRTVELDIFAYTNGENTRPLPFRAQFIPRSEKIVELLEKERDEAEQFLTQYNGETKLTLADVF